jgi:hypothetical protein
VGLSSKKRREEFDPEVMLDYRTAAARHVILFSSSFQPLLLIVADHAPPTLGTLSFFFFF